MKIFEFEVYTKCKATGESGWDIAFPLVMAETKDDATNKLEEMLYFDTFIMFNWGVPVEEWSGEPTELNKLAIGLLGGDHESFIITTHKSGVSDNDIDELQSKLSDVFPHDCTCGVSVQFDDAIFIGTQDSYGGIDHYNCPECKTTFIKKLRKR